MRRENSEEEEGFSDDSIAEKLNAQMHKNANSKRANDLRQNNQLHPSNIDADQNQDPDRQLEDWNFLDNLPPSLPIAASNYSLDADMLFGWQPKAQFTGPVAMTFSQPRLLILVYSLLSKSEGSTGTTSNINNNTTTERYRLIYLGFRPNNTVSLHSAYSDSSIAGAYPYKFMQVTKKIPGFSNMIDPKVKEGSELPFQGMNPALNPAVVDEPYLHFDSFFECGNLDCAIQVKPNEYDLFMRVDSNTKGHLSWFNFNVSNASKGQTVKFNLCNFTKTQILYMRGMKPYVRSAKKNPGLWKQAGDKVSYTPKEWRYAFLKEEQHDTKPRQLFQLSFEYTFEADEDVVSFAYSPPYSFSTLLDFIKDLSTAEKESQLGSYLKESKLCQTVGGLDVPVLTITDFRDSSPEDIAKRKMIIVSARIHPGESNSSWLMHGFLQFLCSKEARALRKKCVFKVVPMMNPDGVILGNFRTGIAGRDLNRVFAETDKFLFPTVGGLKDLVREAQQKHGVNNVAMFLDFHGHSVKKNVFTYGPDYPIYNTNYYKTRLFSKILARRTTMFRYFSCIFRLSQMKKNAARGVFFKCFNIPNCFTVEASNGSFYRGYRDTVEFTADLYSEVGTHIALAIDEYVQTIIDYENWQAAQQQQMQLNGQTTVTDFSMHFRVKMNQKPTAEEQALSQRSTSEMANHTHRSLSKRIISSKQSKRQPKYSADMSEDEVNNHKSQEQSQSQQLGNESDNFSEKGMDSDSDEDDYDKTFLKQFKTMMVTNQELVRKYFVNLNLPDLEKSVAHPPRLPPRKRSKKKPNSKVATPVDESSLDMSASVPNRPLNQTTSPLNEQHSLSPLSGFITRFRDPRPPMSLLLQNHKNSLKNNPLNRQFQVDKYVKKYVSEERKNPSSVGGTGYVLPIGPSPKQKMYPFSRSALGAVSHSSQVELMPLSSTSNVFEMNLPPDHLKLAIKRNEVNASTNNSSSSNNNNNNNSKKSSQIAQSTKRLNQQNPSNVKLPREDILGNKVIVVQKRLQQYYHKPEDSSINHHAMSDHITLQFPLNLSLQNDSTASSNINHPMTEKSIEVLTSRETISSSSNNNYPSMSIRSRYNRNVSPDFFNSKSTQNKDSQLYNVPPPDISTVSAAAYAKRFLNFQAGREISPFSQMLLAGSPNKTIKDTPTNVSTTATNNNNNNTSSVMHSPDKRRRIISLSASEVNHYQQQQQQHLQHRYPAIIPGSVKVTYPPNLYKFKMNTKASNNNNHNTNGNNKRAVLDQPHHEQQQHQQ